MKQLWYSRSNAKDSPDTVHQVLAFGTLQDIKSLKNNLGNVKLKQLFLSYPKKIYTPSMLNFIKNFILNIDKQIDEQKYLKNTPRNIR